MEASLHLEDDNTFELDLTISLLGLFAPTTQQKQVPKEDAVFTKTFRTMAAPIKEIFTSRYIPNVGPIKLVAINKNPVKRDVSSPKPIHIVVKRESPAPRSGFSQGRSVYRPADSYRPSPGSSHASRSNTPRNGSRNGTDSSQMDTETTHNARQNQRGRRRSSYSSRAPSEPAIKIEREKTPALSMSMDVDIPLALHGLPAIDTPKMEIEPATIEIENLDPGTTAEDVKVSEKACLRFKILLCDASWLYGGSDLSPGLTFRSFAPDLARSNLVYVQTDFRRLLMLGRQQLLQPCRI